MHYHYCDLSQFCWEVTQKQLTFVILTGALESFWCLCPCTCTWNWLKVYQTPREQWPYSPPSYKSKNIKIPLLIRIKGSSMIPLPSPYVIEWAFFSLQVLKLKNQTWMHMSCVLVAIHTVFLPEMSAVMDIISSPRARQVEWRALKWLWVKELVRCRDLEHGYGQVLTSLPWCCRKTKRPAPLL